MSGNELAGKVPKAVPEAAPPPPPAALITAKLYLPEPPPPPALIAKMEMNLIFLGFVQVCQEVVLPFA